MNVRIGMLRGFLLLLLAFSLTALHHYAMRPTTLTIGVFSGGAWGTPSENVYELADAVIAAFRKKHPDVQVRYVSGIQREDYSEWLAESMLRGDEPDLFLVLPEDFALYASTEVLMNLWPWMEGDPDFDPSLYYPAALSYGRHGEMQAALPMESMPILMFVNRTLLENEGIPMPQNNWTWAEFLDICRNVTKDTNGDGSPDQFGCYGFSWQTAAVANGVLQLFRRDGKVSYFASPAMEETMRFMVELHAMEGNRKVTARDFDTGHVAFRPFTFAEYRAYEPYPWHTKKYSGFAWDCVRLPAGPSGKGQSFLDTILVGISADTPHPDLAWDCLKLMCYDKDIQQLIVEKMRGLPSRRDILDTEESQQALQREANGQMNLRVVGAVMDDAVESPKLSRRTPALLFADAEIQKIIYGTEPFHDTLNRLQKEVNAYLQH